MLNECKRAIAAVHDADVEPVNQRHMIEALGNLERFENFFVARNCLCNFGRVGFADCYWYEEVRAKRDEMNELHEETRGD